MVSAGPAGLPPPLPGPHTPSRARVVESHKHILVSGLFGGSGGKGFGQFLPPLCQGLEAEAAAGERRLLPPGGEGGHGAVLHPLQVPGLPGSQPTRPDCCRCL